MTTLRVRPTLGRTTVRRTPLRPDRTRSAAARWPPTLVAEWAPVLDAVAEGALQRELDGELPVEAVRLPQVRGLRRAARARRVRRRRARPRRADPAVDRARRRRRQPAAGLPRPLRPRRGPAVAPRPVQRPARVVRPLRGRRDGRQRLVGGRLEHRPAAHRAAPARRRLLPARRHEVLHDRHASSPSGPTSTCAWRRPATPTRSRTPTAIALVDTRDPGVSVTDDWNGFGQRGTGSGTTTFDNVGVPADHVLPFEERFPYQTAFYQLNLLATLTGIARAALADVVDAVQKPHPQLLPRQRAARARRRPGARPGRRDRRRGVRRRGRHAARRGQRPGGRRRRAAPAPTRSPRWSRPARSSPPPRRSSSPSSCCGRRPTSSTPSAPRRRRARSRWTATGATPAPSPRTTRASSRPASSAPTPSTARRRRTPGRSAAPAGARTGPTDVRPPPELTGHAPVRRGWQASATGLPSTPSTSPRDGVVGTGRCHCYLCLQDR